MLGELLALSTAIFWSLAPLLYQRGLRDIHPIFGTIIRMIPATILIFTCSVIILGSNGVFSISLPILIVMLISGALGYAIADFLFIYSIKLTGPGRTATFTSSYPIMILLLSFLFFAEKMQVFTIVGTLFVFGGICLVSMRNSNLKWEKKGLLIATFSAFLASVSMMLIKLLPLNSHPLTVTSWRLIGALFVTPFLFIPIRKERVFTKMHYTLYFFIGGIIGLGLGWITLVYSMNLIGVTKAATLSSISPILTTLGEFVTEKRVDIRLLMGSILATFGVILVTI